MDWMPLFGGCWALSLRRAPWGGGDEGPVPDSPPLVPLWLEVWEETVAVGSGLENGPQAHAWWPPSGGGPGLAQEGAC